MKERKAASLIVSICYLAYAALFSYLLISGRIQHYLHPRMNIYVFAAALFFFTIFAADVYLFFSKRACGESIGVLSLIMLSVPFLCFAFSLSDRPTQSTAQEKTFVFSAEKPDSSAEEEPGSRVFKEKAEDDRSYDIDDTEEPLYRGEAQEAAVPSSGPIVMSDENFWQILTILYEYPEKYRGREIEVAGFVSRDGGQEADTCFVSRNLIWCCAADMYAVGFYSRSQLYTAFGEGEWVQVKGVLGARDWKFPVSGETGSIPEIEVAEVRPAAEPEMPYVFPRY